MRSWGILVLSLALGLAGCQSGQSARERESSSDPALKAAMSKAIQDKVAENKGKEYEPSAAFATRYNAAVSKMTGVLLRQCLDHAGTDQMDGCIRDRVIVGFDQQGVVAPHCPAKGTLEEQVDCIVLRAYSLHLVQRITGEPDPAFDWSDPQSTTKEVVVDFIVAAVERCLGGASASDVTDCVARGFEKRLDLSEAETEPCRALTDDEELGRCIGEAFSIRFMEQGIARM